MYMYIIMDVYVYMSFYMYVDLKSWATNPIIKQTEIWEEGKEQYFPYCVKRNDKFEVIFPIFVFVWLEIPQSPPVCMANIYMHLYMYMYTCKYNCYTLMTQLPILP